MAKTGRNDPCPCGSRIKYKKCHGHPVNFKKALMIDEAVRYGHMKVRQHRAEEALYKSAHGNVRPLISLEHNGMRLTAVGNEIHYSKIAKQPYFIDFLRTYLQNKLTREFFNAELERLPEKRHPVMQWYDRMHSYQMDYAKRHGGDNRFPAIGAMHGWYRLAYDLFLIKHNADLEEFLLRRLRDPGQFQGARFELVCLAALICAGYKIELEDEGDSEQKHVEFVAVAPDGLRIAVEAKSRHREGVLGYSRGGRFAGRPMSTNLGADDLLRNALAKSPKIPYLVFIDINLPDIPLPKDGSEIGQEIKAAVEKAIASYPAGECPANAFVFCNDPSHHAPDALSEPNDTWFFLAPVNEPLVPLELELMKRALFGCKSRLNIPAYFPLERQ